MSHISNNGSAINEHENLINVSDVDFHVLTPDNRLPRTKRKRRALNKASRPDLPQLFLPKSKFINHHGV